MAAPAGESALKVVSFNVRYGTANDGRNAWEHRKDLVVRHLAELDADLVGAQEMMAFQSDYVEAKLPQYARVGVGRIDGKREGEYSAVYYRRDRFELLDEGHFWLSPTPEVVGSNGWDAQLPRVATWVELRDRRAGRRLLFLNTHFDHVGEASREQAARLVRARIEARAGVPAIVTGDFNDAPGSAAHRLLTDGPLTDTFLAVHVEEMGGTFHGFGEIELDIRIDWILCTPSFSPVAAAIEAKDFDGRWPSDHHAVSARLSWRP